MMLNASANAGASERLAEIQPSITHPPQDKHTNNEQALQNAAP
jgi:hypothetical protein